MEFSVNPCDGFFEIKLAGEAKLETYGEFLDALVSHGDWKPGTPIFVDEVDLETGPLQVRDVEEIARMCGDRRVEIGQARVALLAGRDLEFGFIRMWGVFVEDKWDVTANVFKSREDAMAWLMAFGTGRRIFT